MKEAVGKLSADMTIAELQLLLVFIPHKDIGSGAFIYIYSFPGGETLNFSFVSAEEKLSDLRNKSGINLLATEFTATVEGFPVFVDGEEIVVSNPIVTIDKNRYANFQHLPATYVPIEDIAEYLGITVTFNAEKQLLEIVIGNTGNSAIPE